MQTHAISLAKINNKTRNTSINNRENHNQLHF